MTKKDSFFSGGPFRKLLRGSRKLEPIVVPQTVAYALEALCESSEFKAARYDIHRMSKWLRGNGYPYAASWILEHETEYLDGLFAGFCPPEK